MSDQDNDIPPTPKKKAPPRNRRSFFGELFHAIATPLVDMADERFNLGLKDIRRFARPPGAIPESQFTERCEKTGYCIEACPVKAIIPLPEYKHHKLAGTPVVVADSQPCVMCYDLACMAVCPTGSIIPMGREEVRMGLAQWKADTCLRTQGDSCQICVDKCPFHERVIKLDADGKVAINDYTCTGCGVCAFYCPTNPKSIVIDPK